MFNFWSTTIIYCTTHLWENSWKDLGPNTSLSRGSSLTSKLEVLVSSFNIHIRNTNIKFCTIDSIQESKKLKKRDSEYYILSKILHHHLSFQKKSHCNLHLPLAKDDKGVKLGEDIGCMLMYACMSISLMVLYW